MNLFRSSSPKNQKETPKEDSGKLTLHPGISPIDSAHSTFVFLKHALEQIIALKESKKVRESVQKSIDTLNRIASTLPATDSNGQPPKLAAADMSTIVDSLKQACETKVPAIQTLSLDCIGKCFTYHFWGKADDTIGSLPAVHTKPLPKLSVSDDGDSQPIPIYPELHSNVAVGYAGNQIIPDLVNVMCACFVESEQTDEKVQLMLVKSLLAAISCSSPPSALHGESLLIAVRTTFRIFLLSKSSNAQIIAQATLTQMLQVTFGRCQLEQTAAADMQLRILYGQDAFRMFGLLYELANESFTASASDADMKNNGIRTKLIALHMLNAVLTQSPKALLVPTSSSTILIDDIKPYLCVLLSRNASSIVPPVMEVSMELVAKTLINFKSYMKAELSLLWSQLVQPMVTGKPGITFTQRLAILRLFQRLATDKTLSPTSCESGAKFIIEMFLNFDCDLSGGSNINYVENLFTSLTRIISSTFVGAASAGAITALNTSLSPQHVKNALSASAANSHLFASANHSLNTANTLTAASQALQASSSRDNANAVMPPAFTSQNLGPITKDQLKDFVVDSGDQVELARQALETLVSGLLRSLSIYLRSLGAISEDGSSGAKASPQIDEDERSFVSKDSGGGKDDSLPAIKFALLKQKKQAFEDGTAKFNWKPKRGVEYWLNAKLIATNTPEAVGQFLYEHHNALDKKMLGEYLGEGEDWNINVMRAFLLQFEFTGLKIVEAIRLLLQSFHLPGESQKIDRFMLQFADLYVRQNPGIYASGDTAYVLSYSIIMLNTDQHNPQVKRRMTKDEFIRNNRGIDNGADLPRELLESVYNEISRNEIKINPDLVPAKPPSSRKPAAKDRQLTETVQLSVTNILSKADGGEHSEWFESAPSEIASNIASLLETVWMSLLTSLSSPFQQTDDPEIVCLCLDGLRYAAHLASANNLTLPRQAFIGSLSKFTQLSQITELRPKNVEAIKALLFVALADGNGLESSWSEVFSCIVRLERLNALSGSGASAIPNDIVSRAIGNKPIKLLFLEENVPETSSSTIVKAIDRLFVETVKLSGPAIVQFVTYLCRMSLDEINQQQVPESSGETRLYCLQRLVEISYYNMRRIRLEWSQIWAILGEHFNAVGSTKNVTTTVFVLDKLRQLALKFLEMEELAHFKFQREFLKPFQRIMQLNATTKEVQDMVLVSLQQIIQSRAAKLASGWSMLFEILADCAAGSIEALLKLDFDIIKSTGRSYLQFVLKQGAFSNLVDCIAVVAKNGHVPKYHVAALELLKEIVPRASAEADPALITSIWQSCIATLYDLISNSDDLEVRSRALQIMFGLLNQYGPRFEASFMTLVFEKYLIPLVSCLPDSEEQREGLDDSRNMWLGTTFIQALRLFVSFYKANFALVTDAYITRVFEILTQCLRFREETIARIGGSCLLDFVHGLQANFTTEHWDALGAQFRVLVDETLPKALFDADLQDAKSSDESTSQKIAARKKTFSRVVQQSVLHLICLETLQDILQNDADLLQRLQPQHFKIFCACFSDSFEFAHRFNENIERRQALLHYGFMRQLPHLLKQETSAASGLLGLLIRLLTDETLPAGPSLRVFSESQFFPLSLTVLRQYNELDVETKQKHIQHWRPIVCDILDAQSDLDDELFAKHLPSFYIDFTHLLLQDTSTELRTSLCSLLIRTGLAFSIIREDDLLEKYSTQPHNAVQPEVSASELQDAFGAGLGDPDLGSSPKSSLQQFCEFAPLNETESTALGSAANNVYLEQTDSIFANSEIGFNANSDVAATNNKPLVEEQTANFDQEIESYEYSAASFENSSQSDATSKNATKSLETGQPENEVEIDFSANEHQIPNSEAIDSNDINLKHLKQVPALEEAIDFKDISLKQAPELKEASDSNQVVLVSNQQNFESDLAKANGEFLHNQSEPFESPSSTKDISDALKGLPDYKMTETLNAIERLNSLHADPLEDVHSREYSSSIAALDIQIPDLTSSGSVVEKLEEERKSSVEHLEIC